MSYVRLCKSVYDKGMLIKPENLWDNIQDPSKEHYVSLFEYTEEHFKQFQQTKTVKGIKDTTTNRLLFDLDNKDDPSLAINDAKELIQRLTKHNIKEKDIEIYFSGNKGVHVSVTLNNRKLTPTQAYSLAVNKFGKDLKTLDPSVYDASQIIRVPGTKHASGLYKIPLTWNELQTLTLDQIKTKAKSLDNITEEFSWEEVNPSEEFFKVVEEKVKKNYTVDLTKKDSRWRNCKWSLLQGNFDAGQRHQALLTIAATARGLGYDKETAYYMCKSALKKQAAKTGTDDFPKEELWNNIIEASIYKEGWEGGSFTCQKVGWLQTYCKSLDRPCEAHSDTNTIKIEEAFGMFKNYATNIDQNTILTGIKPLDDRLRMTVGMSVGVVAPPGAGKTSLVLQVLNSLSNSGEQALFLSYDMFHALVFQKLIQRHFNVQPRDIFETFKSNDIKTQNKYLSAIKEQYKHVEFCFRAGQTYEQILDTIKEAEDNSGKKVKLIACDYNELVQSGMSDGTASSNYVAQKMREIANVKETCVLSLFQPSKLSGSPSDEITSYRAAKGGSGIEQSVSVMLGMSRPGYDPRKFHNDKFMAINCLKNRMGGLFGIDLYWDGLTGSLREMTEEEERLLQQIRDEKDNKDKDKNGWE